MFFREVVGQETLKQKLIQLVHEKHLPHAILFLAKEGGGGLPMALALAQFIQCNNKEKSDSCGECSSCVKMQKLQHPDVHFSFPTIRKEGSSSPPISNDFILEFRNFVLQNPYGDEQSWLQFLGAEKQGNITAQECRDIIRKLNLRSFESEYKLLIMWCPENLGNEGNILLKLIEEPTPNTILLFVATQPDRVLGTIQSRTQLFPLQPLTPLIIQQELMQLGVPEQQSLHVAKLSEGNYFKALQLLNESEDIIIEPLKKWLNALYTNKGLDLMEWVGSIAELSKETQKRFLSYTLQLFELTIRFQFIGANAVTVLEQERRIIEILIAKGISRQEIASISNVINDSLHELERNANSKIVFHSLSLRIQQIFLLAKSKPTNV